MAKRRPALRATLKKNAKPFSALQSSTPSSKTASRAPAPVRELDEAANFQSITIEEKHVD